MSKTIRNMINKRKQGFFCGIPSYCTANELVIEAVLEQALRFDDEVLIEATANQVNQFGGYTGMLPEDFKKFVYNIGDKIGFPREKIILGGDHLGPLVWADKDEAEAMSKAAELVRLFVKAGYKKIHLDTSMKLGSDSIDENLPDETIAARGAVLYKACEDAYQELKKDNPLEVRPVYIIGSEVPIPGGAQEQEAVEVTRPEDVQRTIEVYRSEFAKRGYSDAFDNIVGIVVQPGVEFSDEDVVQYDRVKAAELCKAMKQYDGMVMEGHSTDYQSPKHLKEMAEDGIAILKVGPALTFALREALFALSMIENKLVPEGERSCFIETLEEAMLENPGNWEKHYHGTLEQLKIKRKYSYSDRCRYYLTQPKVKKAEALLFANLDKVKIPLSMLRQYLPFQYLKAVDKRLSTDAVSLAKDRIINVVDDYNYAVKYNYMIGNVYI